MTSAKERNQLAKWEALLKKVSTEQVALMRSTAESIGMGVLAGAYELIEVNDEKSASFEMPEDATMDGVVEAILSVGRERRNLLNLLRAALCSNKDDEALMLARQLCNLPKGDGHGGQKTVH